MKRYTSHTQKPVLMEQAKICPLAIPTDYSQSKASAILKTCVLIALLKANAALPMHVITLSLYSIALTHRVNDIHKAYIFPHDFIASVAMSLTWKQVDWPRAKETVRNFHQTIFLPLRGATNIEYAVYNSR